MTKEITIQGKPTPIHYGILTIQTVLKTQGKELGDLLEENPGASIGMICEVSAAALSEGARRAGAKKRYTVDDVVDLIDDDETGELLGTLAGLFSESMTANVEKLGKMGNALAGTNRTPPPKTKR